MAFEQVKLRPTQPANQQQPDVYIDLIIQMHPASVRESEAVNSPSIDTASKFFQEIHGDAHSISRLIHSK